MRKRTAETAVGIMTDGRAEPHWARVLRLLLHGLYFPLMGVVMMMSATAAYSRPSGAEGCVLAAAEWVLLMIPAAAVTATAMQKRWKLRLIVVLIPYAWLACALLVLAVLMLMK